MVYEDDGPRCWLLTATEAVRKAAESPRDDDGLSLRAWARRHVAARSWPMSGDLAGEIRHGDFALIAVAPVPEALPFDVEVIARARLSGPHLRLETVELLTPAPSLEELELSVAELPEAAVPANRYERAATLTYGQAPWQPPGVDGTAASLYIQQRVGEIEPGLRYVTRRLARWPTVDRRGRVRFGADGWPAVSLSAQDFLGQVLGDRELTARLGESIFGWDAGRPDGFDITDAALEAALIAHESVEGREIVVEG